MWPTSITRLTAPHSYKLSTLHLSSSIFNCFLLLPECLFYVRSTMEDFCNIPPNEKLSCSMKKTTLIKHIIPATKAVLYQTNLPFSTFSPRSSLLLSLNNVSIMPLGKEEGELRALIQIAKGSKRRDWRSLWVLSIESHHRDQFTRVT